jgi:mevalonate kinase
MKAVAPGKLILAGEHAVVYGRPALAMAVDRSAQCVITAQASDRVSFELPDLAESGSFTVRALTDLRSRVLRNYQQFLAGQLSIREVLRKPIELFEFAFINILDGLHLKLEQGLSIRTQSNIPIGCGMGSSAATVLCQLRAIGHYFRVEFRPDWVLKYSLEAERLRHGYASGVDAHMSLHGGCALFRGGVAQPVPLPRVPMYLVHTGVPQTGTGEAVVEVRRRFRDAAIWDEFEGVTTALEQALRADDLAGIQQAVRDNHRLLVRIGVVPERVQRFVRDVEMQGGAAKISGAGAVAGDAAGMVLVFAHEPPDTLAAQYGYGLLTLRGDPLGARMV